MPAARRATAAKKDADAGQDAIKPVADAAPKGVHAKLAAIQNTVPSIAKTGHHGQQNFDFIQEHKVFELLRPLLRQHNCSCVVSCADEVVVETKVPFGAKQNPATLVVLKGRVVFTDADTGESVVGTYAGSGIDTQDKAAGKAQTYLTKYALQKFFRIPTEGIDDSDATVDGDQALEVAPGEIPAPATSGASPAPAAAEDAAIGQGAAATIIEGLTGHVQAGELDPNKVKAKLATYQKGEVAALTDGQAQEFLAWVEAEVVKGKAPAG